MRVAVVGGGDAAFDYAVGLSRHNDVTVLIRSDTVRCIPLLRERALAADSIEILWSTAVLSVVLGSDDPLRLVCDSDGSEYVLPCDYAILAVGRKPDLAFLSPELQRRAHEFEHGARGFPGCARGLQRTGCDHVRHGPQHDGRLFFAGDVVGGRCRQAAIAVGQGAMCAMQVAAVLQTGRVVKA
jgi:thioredoxin reductase